MNITFDNYQEYKRVRDRFLEKLPEDRGQGCLLWPGKPMKEGYGRMKIGQKRIVLAHRLAWHFLHGEIPTGLCVLHACDNPPCVNPAHLFLGTRQDNIIDKIKKGRHMNCERGEKHQRSKLSDEQIQLIRSWRKDGETLWFIADLFGVATSTVSKICRYKSRKITSAENDFHPYYPNLSRKKTKP